MKNQQHQAARELYFNSNLSKTEIAERLSVSRRTIYQWSVDGDWENLRESARHMPAILAEKCSYILGHLMDQLLNADASEIAISKMDVDMLHKLTITAAKLKKGSTVAENMQTFTLFLERLAHTDVELAQKVAPHINEYITTRRKRSEHDFLLSGFDETGHLPSQQEEEEKRLDELEAAAMLAEQQQAPSQPKQYPNTPHTHTHSHTHAHSHSHPHTVAQPQTPSGFTKQRPVHTPLHAYNAPPVAA